MVRAIARRGFTLVELLIALVMLGVVTAALYRTLVVHQRAAGAQVQRSALQETLRAAAAILPAELRELDATDGDITAMSATSLSVRSMRQLMLICEPPALGGGHARLTLTVHRVPFHGPPLEPGRDSLFIYYEGDPDSPLDDGWFVAAVSGVSGASCPAAAGGGPGLRLDVTTVGFPGAGQANRAGAVQPGSPARGFRAATYRSYRASDGLWYLGIEAPGQSIQPVIGPLSGGEGATFAYSDATGSATVDLTRVATIEFRLRARSPGPVRAANGALGVLLDSVATRVALRNNRRP